MTIQSLWALCSHAQGASLARIAPLTRFSFLSQPNINTCHFASPPHRLPPAGLPSRIHNAPSPPRVTVINISHHRGRSRDNRDPSICIITTGSNAGFSILTRHHVRPASLQLLDICLLCHLICARQCTYSCACSRVGMALQPCF